jgi:16S rRNA (adenine1518-N6/adenine1519-N6)-dimethyltransferase
MTAPKKSLGQHWLRDRETLAHIADCADIESKDTVLEIGPGLGTLTAELLRRAGRVVAVEFDSDLARKLPAQFPGKELEVVHQDILSFDLLTLPAGYKVVANVPY